MSNDTVASGAQTTHTQDDVLPESVPVAAQITFAIIPEWLLDAGVSGEAVKLYGLLARYANDKTGVAYPKRRTLAERMGKSIRSVSVYLRELESVGAVVCTPKYHPGTREQAGNYYTVMSMPNVTGLQNPATPPSSTLQPPLAESCNPRTRVNERKPVNETPPSPSDDSEQGTLDIPAESAPPTGGGSKPKQKREGYPPEFAAFWEVYPKKADKRAALKAWRAALKRTSQDTIYAGALRYRDDPNRDERFTKNAATWLNADSWENGPLPPRGGNDWNTERQNQNREVMMNAYRQQYGDTNPMMGELGK